MLKNEYYCLKFNTARNCLRYIIQVYNIKEMFIPYYICPAVRNSILKENCKLKFYNIDKKFYPKQEFNEDDFILYPNYFGVCNDIIDKISLKYKNLIIDNAHSFYSSPKGIATFNSLRKFFPKLKDGAFLYIKKIIDGEQLYGCDTRLNKIFPKDDYFYDFEKMNFEEMCKNEIRLDNSDIKVISDCTLKYFYNIDIEKEKSLRYQKFRNYYSKYKYENLLKINITAETIPFALPYLARSKEKADELVNNLSKRNINIYRYWNNLPDSFEEKVFYTNLVVIPFDL